MNEYLKNLKKIEFVITYACTGKCKHCSEGDHALSGERIDAKIAAAAVDKIAAEYPIKTVMTFGGEPLLYPEAVFEIHKAATKLKIPHRQLITNGYFSNDVARIRQVANTLLECGVNDVLLSVDAFHDECIPKETVKTFALAALDVGLPIRTQGAWLVSREHENPYNQKTRELLSEFEELGVMQNEGNIVFPEGNALIYLKEYFGGEKVENPYVEDPSDVKCISFDPNGDFLNSNVYKCDIEEVLKNYNPIKKSKD